ncbi:MAG: hypothetical protein QXS41_01535 [Candidatus Woesearchaeota archaeon]
MKKAFFLMVDGLDGSGKGFVVDYLSELLKKKQLKVYDLRKEESNLNYLPEFKDIENFDVFIFKEPSEIGIGKDLRQEILKKNNRCYSVKTQAQAFAIQREILYKRLVIPALEQMKFILAERGFVSSLVFQPLYSEFVNEKEKVNVDYIISLEGNRLAMSYAPDYLLVVDCDVKQSVERLNLREKKDHAIYETEEFQKILREVYLSKRKLTINNKEYTLKDYLEKLGTKSIIVDSSKTEEITKSQVENFLNSIFK